MPVDPGSVHDWQLARLGGRLDRAQTELEAASDLFSVAAPTDTIAAVRATSRVSGERLLILGGDAAVLLLGFAVLAATRLRRDHRAMRRRLTWIGARPSQPIVAGQGTEREPGRSGRPMSRPRAGRRPENVRPARYLRTDIEDDWTFERI